MHGRYIRATCALVKERVVYIPAVTVWRQGQWLGSTFAGNLPQETKADALETARRLPSRAWDLPLIEME